MSATISKQAHHSGWVTFVVAGLGLVALASTLVGASVAANGTADADGVATAKAWVSRMEKPISKGPPGPAFDASDLRGKKVWFVSFPFSINYSQQVWRGVKEAAKELGFTVKSFDGKFSPADTSRGIDLAVQDNADAIIVHSLPPAVVAPAISRAAKAGVKIIAAEIQNPGPPLPGTPKTVSAIAGHSYSIPTKTMASQVVADSKGKANVLFFSVNDIGPGSKQGTTTFLATMKNLCPSCKVQVNDAPVAQWSGLTTRIASLLRSNPSVNYVVPIFDGMAVYLVPGIRSAGAANRVKIVTGDATASVIENIKRKNIVIGDVGQPNVWTGWAIVDQTARVLAGKKPLQDVGIQYRLFTAKNVGKINTNSDPTTWYGQLTFRADYKKIWGVR
jgi:ribose transport system substrate-binding protein